MISYPPRKRAAVGRNFANTSSQPQQQLWLTGSHSKSPFRRTFKIYLFFVSFSSPRADASGSQSSLPGSVEFRTKETKVLQSCLVPSPGPAVQMEQLQGNKRNPCWARWCGRGGPGLPGDSRAEAWGHCTKADLRPSEAAREARGVHPETPTKLLTSLQSEFILK